MKYSAIKTKVILVIIFLLTFSSYAISLNFNKEIVVRNDTLHFDIHQNFDTLKIDSYNGKIILISGEDGNRVHGKADTWAYGRSEEQAQKRLSKIGWKFTESGNTLKLKLTGTGGGSHITELMVPATWNLNINTSNGRINISNGFNNIHAESSNGSILITGGDSVIAGTSNGRIDYNGSSQKFDLDSTNGEIRVQLNGNWKGKGKAHSSNGDVTVISSGIIDARINSSTGNGKSYFYGRRLSRTTGTGKLSLSASNGNINVAHGVNIQ